MAVAFILMRLDLSDLYESKITEWREVIDIRKPTKSPILLAGLFPMNF